MNNTPIILPVLLVFAMTVNAQIENNNTPLAKGWVSESEFHLGEQFFAQSDSFCECESLAHGANESWPTEAWRP